MSTHHPRNTSTAICLVALVASATLVACGKSDTGATTTISDNTAAPSGAQSPPAGAWNLVSFAGPQGVTPAAAGPTATLRFGTGGTLDGTTGCNNFRGTFTSAGDSLTIEVGPMTQMACTDPAVAVQEQALLAGLPRVARFESRDAGLTLSDGSGAVLFEYAEGVTGIAGTAWRATGVNTGTGVETTALTEMLTAVFGTDSRISGSGGCNTFSAAYTESGDSISITGLTATESACAPDVTALEQKYFAALQAATTLEIRGDLLTLRDAGGSTQVAFRAEAP